ncbi:MAG: hypothetical protein U1C46_05375 [Bacteroidales bacterium]|nr:hypothetical protein [Bacteroidales bacterium]MDZ4204231.1 hypothetical protein [Bacteroidales bacterium]
MKKAIFTFSLLAMTVIVMAGGIVTNTNQSASFIRMPARDATLGIDAAYYNPAGMSLLKDGFHLSLNNQYITQTRTIGSSFRMSNLKEFEGGVTAPIFPSVYAVYKKNKFAFALALNPIGGGGSAAYENGLPSLENQVAIIPASLTAGGVPTTKYSLDVDFEGKSIIWGVQGSAAYQANDIVSIAAGLRYVSVSNSYKGYMKDIKINPNIPAVKAEYNGANMVKATTFFSDFSAYLLNVSGVLNGTGQGLQPIITGGGGAVLLSNGTAAGLTAAQVAQLQATITALGGNHTTMTIAQSQAFFFGASATYATNSTVMAANSQATKDMELDAVQKGTGFVPIIGVNFQFSDNFSVAVKYEHRASMKVKNETTKDDVKMFPDGDETPNDMPSMLAVGTTFAPISKIKFHAGIHYYLDKNAEYGKKKGGVFVKNSEVMDGNLWEGAVGLEYQIFDKLLVSAGYLRTQTGVTTLYQNDISHSLSTNSVGGGIKYMVTPNIGLNLGAMNTWYLTDVKINSITVAGTAIHFAETYDRKAMVIAFGVDFSF